MKNLWAMLLLFVCCSCFSQEHKLVLPKTAPIEFMAQPYSLSVNASERYSFLKDQFTNVMGINIERRFFNSSLRFGLGYNHTIQTGENNITTSVNYKFLAWGKK